MRGRAAEMRLKKVLLPALGKPTKPKSANTFNSKISVTSSPGCPFSAMCGAVLLRVLKDWFPLPPIPPRATKNSCPGWVKSAMIWPSLFTIVPQGTRIYLSSPARPVLL